MLNSSKGQWVSTSVGIVPTSVFQRRYIVYIRFHSKIPKNTSITGLKSLLLPDGFDESFASGFKLSRTDDGTSGNDYSDPLDGSFPR